MSSKFSEKCDFQNSLNRKNLIHFNTFLLYNICKIEALSGEKINVHVIMTTYKDGIIFQRNLWSFTRNIDLGLRDALHW